MMMQNLTRSSHEAKDIAPQVTLGTKTQAK